MANYMKQLKEIAEANKQNPEEEKLEFPVTLNAPIELNADEIKVFKEVEQKKLKKN